MNFRPLSTQVLVKLVEDKTESVVGELYLPDSAKNQNTVYAVVQALGSGINSRGQSVPFTVCIGDRVLMPRYTQIPAMKHDDDIYVVTNEDEILGIVGEESS